MLLAKLSYFIMWPELLFSIEATEKVKLPEWNHLESILFYDILVFIRHNYISPVRQAILHFYQSCRFSFKRAFSTIHCITHLNGGFRLRNIEIHFYPMNVEIDII